MSGHHRSLEMACEQARDDFVQLRRSLLEASQAENASSILVARSH
jgi:hypothetical protein